MIEDTNFTARESPLLFTLEKCSLHNSDMSSLASSFADSKNPKQMGDHSEMIFFIKYVTASEGMYAGNAGP